MTSHSAAATGVEAPYRPTVCVDLNGVLDQYTGWQGGRWYAPRTGAGDFLAALVAGGYRVVVLSTREADGVWLWLQQHDLARHVADVTSVKLPAVAYIDDRAICFRGDYAATLRELDGFNAHWEDA